MPSHENKTLLALYQNRDGSFGYWIDFGNLSRTEIADIYLTMEAIKHDILSRESKSLNEDVEDIDEDEINKHRDLLDS